MVYKLVGGIKAGKTGYYSNALTKEEPSATDTKDPDDETNVVSTEKNYCSVIKKVKKDNITPENIGEIMLCQIPGISTTSALAILAQFKTLPNLIEQMKADEKCLNNIVTTDANGKTRKISKTAIATIIKFLRV